MAFVANPGLAARRRNVSKLFGAFCFLAAVSAVLLLVILLYSIFSQGLGRLNWEFITSFPREMVRPPGGILPGLVGSAVLVLICGMLTIPFGVAASVYLEEFADRRSKFSQFIEININNLSGVPSIVFGMLGLAIFREMFGMEAGILAGALTMSLLILPTVILVSREAIRAVPQSLREGSLALGSTQGQMVWRMVLPNALPGILTGIILAISRAIGETAPLIVVGAATLVTNLPKDLNSGYTALPLQIFDWAARPNGQAHFSQGAAAAIIVLMVTLLLLNSVAIIIRARAQKKQRA